MRLPVVYKSNLFFLVEAHYRAGYFHSDAANGHEVKPEDIHVTFNDVKGVSFRIDVKFFQFQSTVQYGIYYICLQ